MLLQKGHFYDSKRKDILQNPEKTESGSLKAPGGRFPHARQTHKRPDEENAFAFPCVGVPCVGTAKLVMRKACHSIDCRI